MSLPSLLILTIFLDYRGFLNILDEFFVRFNLRFACISVPDVCRVYYLGRIDEGTIRIVLYLQSKDPLVDPLRDDSYILLV